MKRLIKSIKSIIYLGCATAFPLMAQTFSGTNAPNSGSNFSFPVGAGATNLSLVISNNATSFSHLLLKRGGVPTSSDFDFIARLDGATNQISLENPEFTTTNFGLRVFTPANSAQHIFNVTLITNNSAIRSATFPAIKPVLFSTTGSLTNSGGGAWNYFQIDVPTNLPGWRIVLSHTGTGNPNLYVRRGALPTTGLFDKSSTSQSIDTIVFSNSEATNTTYFIGVNLPSGTANFANYTLSTETNYLTTLTWDAGTTHEGSQIFTNKSATGGDYYFKITAQNTTVGAWRTALKVTSGEADLYLRKNTFAVGTSSYNTKISTKTGSDGFVLSSPEFSAGQDFYILVHADPGAQWSLVSGEAYVLNLGNLAVAGSTATSTNVSVGPEGIRFFKTTIPAGTLAWRLGLNGATNDILVRKTLAPSLFSSSTYDLKQSSQMLVVPTYLTGNTTYFIGVPGAPGSSVDLDCRQQTITDIPFTTTNSFSASGFGYTTFRVQVPVQQIAWMTTLNTTSGDANLSVRRNSVANEFNNDAFSEVSGLANESLLLVPPALSDGTFYITVYGTNSYTCTLSSGNPPITDIPFSGLTTNDNPTLAGWRLYRVPDINSQLGFIGWDLFLANQPAGTEIALRRNAVPGRWNYRNNSTSISSQGYVDYSSTKGFLQRQDHQADIWYVGVYSPNDPLGNFILDRRTYAATNVDSVANATNIVDQPANQFRYFQINVPAGVLGWDLRITNVTSGDPRLVVRCDRLPDGTSTRTDTGSGWSASSSSTWPSGYQWAAGSDWTGFNNSAQGTNESGRILEMGMGNPLEPGTYYVGIIGPSGATTPLSYALSSRFIGAGQQIVPAPLTLNGGSIGISNLVPREVAYFSLDVPTNTSSVRLKLSADAGESRLIVQRDIIPNIGASGSTPTSGGAKMAKDGDETYFILPTSGQSNVAAGTYYIGVVSEGMNPGGSSRIGTNSSSATLTSMGELPVFDLGPLGGSNIVRADTIPSAELKAFQFTLPPNLLGVEVRLENRTGNPKMTLRAGTSFPAASDSYGNYGGQSATWSSTDLIYLATPASGIYTLLVQAGASNSVYVPSGFTIRIHTVSSSSLAFDGGVSTVVNQPNDTWRFFNVTVPSNTFGWDLRLTNVSSGDPRIVVRRGLAPASVSTLTSGGSGWSAAGSTTWPVGYQWAPGTDYTGYSQDANGTNSTGHALTVGIGNPLEPGDYIVGIYTGTGAGSANPMSYTLASRGIGDSFSIPIQELNFAGGSVTASNLAPRDFAFYRVVVPSNTPNWNLVVTNLVGESELILQRDALPNIGAGTGALPYNLSGGHQVKRVGDETYTLLPANSQTNVAAGTYYLALVSEGVNPTSTRAGTNFSSATLTSVGSLPVSDIGILSSGNNITSSSNLPAGHLQFYQFTVSPGVLSLQLRLNNRVGNPKMTLRRGSLVPATTDSYGNDGGSNAEWNDASFIDIPNPTPGLYTLTIQAGASSGIYADASFTIELQASGSTPLAIDSSVNVTNQPSGTWRYFYVTIPTNALGWDVRISDVKSGDPRLVVRREQLPTSLSTLTSGGSGWSVYSSTSWPTNYQWGAASDWTGYASAANGTNESGHIIAAGMNNPLSPGNYYVGVFNGTGPGSANPMTYTLTSRGIGNGFAIPVTPIAFNETVNRSGLAVRETEYFQITIASNTPNWKLRLAPTVGQAVLTVNKSTLPSVLAGDSAVATGLNGGHRMQRLGNEYYLLLPPANQTNLLAGDYFIGVTSEGVDPTSTRSGSNTVSYTLSSLGSQSIENLGTVGGADLVRANELDGGDISLFQFTVPAGTPSIEVRLENPVGGPKMTLRRGGSVTEPKDSYGNDGGDSATWDSASLITIANPVATNYSLTVQAPAGSISASFVLRIHGATISNLNFAANLNTNGLLNSASNALLDNQRDFYRIEVPATNNGAPVIGWRLNLSQTTGSASLRARKDILPSDADSNLMPFTTTEAVLVPPFLTPGTWYVEVKASGSTTYTLTSSNVELERAPWAMPMMAQSTTTPGLTSPDFGDSGVQTNGVPLSGDQGVDVNQGGFHYYAVDVPEFNGGIMRVVLEAISGNPDFYLRYGALPTISHGNTGTSGSLYDRLLNGTGTEYANWVALDGRTEKSLKPGRWFVAVRASGNSNARYRLRLSTGNVEDISLSGANLTDQIVAAKDFRYYRVIVPTNAPTAWQVSFNQQIGDVLLYVRDTTPPGQGDSVTQFKDWSTDNKNHGPYSTYDASGTYTLNVPPLRPGHTYFLGFRGITDSTFSLTTATNGTNINVAAALDFYNGAITNVIPAFGKLTFRIDVPSDARRIRLTNTAPASVKWYLEQGTLPTLTSSDDWSGTGSILLNQAITGTWPWVSSQLYFLTVTNTSATAQSLAIQMDGRDCSNDDNDSDGLPDCWEQTYFGNTSSYNGTSDADNDGNSNLQEYLDGTDPTLSTSMLARLTVVTNGPGSVALSAVGPFFYGSNVTLTATANAGYVLQSWTGAGIFSTNNPLVISMTTNRTITANFAYDYGAPGITRADYQFSNTLASSVGAAPDLQYIGSNHFFTNLVVNGPARTVLRFPQGSGLALQPTTTVFSSNVYTVALVFQLDTVSGYRRVLDTKNAAQDQGLYVHDGKLVLYPLGPQSEVCVNSNTWYQLVFTRDDSGAVKVYLDGTLRLSVNDANGYSIINSSASMRFFKDDANENSAGYVARIRNFATALTPEQVAAIDPLFTNLGLNGAGEFTFTLVGPVGISCAIEGTTNFTTWDVLTNLSDFPGTMDFVLPRAKPVQLLRVRVK
jgi:hypothetical protein